MRDGALHGRESVEEPGGARYEVEKLEQPKRVLPRVAQGSRRSEERIPSGTPDGDRSFGSLHGADARAPAGRDDVDVVPFARVGESFRLDEVAGAIPWRSWIG